MEEAKENLIFTNQRGAVKELDIKLKDLKLAVSRDYPRNKITLDIVSRNGKAIEIKLEIIPDTDYIDKAFKLNLGFLGVNKITDDFRFELRKEQDKNKALLTWKNHATEKDTEISNHIELTLYNKAYESINLNSWVDIDLSKEKDNLSYELNIYSDQFRNIDIKGKGDFKSSLKNIEYNFHKLSYNMEDSYSNKRIDLEGSLFLSSSEGVENIPIIKEEEKVKVLQLLEHDIFKILENLEKVIKNILL